MKLVVPRESAPGECRVAATPDTVTRLAKLGHTVRLQRGAGNPAGFSDAEYEQAGAELFDGDDGWSGGEAVLKVEAPRVRDDGVDELSLLSEGQILISMLWPAQNQERVEQIAAAGVSAIALDRIPRISRAQKMDVLSSMANIAGYRAIVEASHVYPRFFGGQITAAGKTRPAKVLVIGAGVAGLAAIAAARGLGAEVYAFDTRAAAREQVESLGARFLEVTFEESGEGAGGYAKVMSKEFIEAEMALFAEHAPTTDVVVTTALIPGRKAPLLWTRAHVEAMQAGSVVVDLAAVQGGNCEVTVPGQKHVHEGVTVLGFTDLVSRLPSHASQFFARNLTHLVDDMTREEGQIALDLEDEVVRTALITHGGEVLPPPPPPEPSPQPAKPAPASAPVVVAAPSAEPSSGAGQSIALVAFAALLAAAGQFAPGDFLQHLTVFILACFIGWQVIWNVSPALHTPLMSVTNAISGIILVGGMLQAGSGNMDLAAILGGLAILFAAINVAGGFLVTQRMLAMFRK